jgi:spore maturation protein CgeB
MYEGFKRLIMDDDLRVKISKRAYEFVRDRFGLDETIEKLANVYKHLGDAVRGSAVTV